MFPRFDFPQFVVWWTREKEINEGSCPPGWYYGHAYSMYNRQIRVFAVIPLNYLIRFWMWASHRWERFRCGVSWFDREIRRQYSFGYQDGLRDGLRDNEEALERITNLMLDAQAKKANPILVVKNAVPIETGKQHGDTG